MSLVLPWPPTVNTFYRMVNNRMIMSADGRAYKDAVSRLVNAEVESQRQRIFGASDRLKVEITAFPPDRRRRDLDNMFKSVLDSLTMSGIWADDSQIDDLRIRRAPEIKGMIVVDVEVCP
jgi:crossover junction endodeoxyribonuclease RusA